MAAGLGFKDFQTGEVLTAADVDGYLMQGVWVFASAAARDAAVTSPQEGNFAYLKDTNVTTYYTGSAWANLDTTGMTNPMTTTGDTIYSSSGSTPARLGIGTAGQVLTVNSGATAPEWASAASGGGMTLLSTTTLSGASTTVSVGTGYTDLYVLVYGVTNNTTDQIMTMRTQNSGSVYRYAGVRKTASVSAVAGGPDTYWNLGMNDYPLRTNANNIWTIRISDYLNTSHYKTMEWVGSFVYAGPNQGDVFGGGVVLDNSAITDLVFANTGGTFSAGTVKLYGVK